MGTQKVDLSHGGLDVSPRVIAATAAVTARYGDFIRADTSGGAFNVTLPLADRIGLVRVQLVAGTSAAIVRDGADTINGATSLTLTTPLEIVELLSNGAGSWYRLSGSFTLSALKEQFVQAAEDVVTVAASGAAYTVPEPSAYGLVDLTLSAATVALTFPTVTKGKRLRLVIRQDGTGNRAVTWPAGSIFPGGTDVVITTAASSIDYVEAFSVVEGTWMITRVGAAYAV